MKLNILHVSLMPFTSLLIGAFNFLSVFQIDIFSSEKRGFPAMQLTDEYLNSVNSLNVFHPTLNLLAGGNSSGKVYLWSE